MVLRIVAIDSLAASMGPPGSANEIANPATMGARTMRDHSSSVKALFDVTALPSSSWSGQSASAGPAPTPSGVIPGASYRR